MTLSNAAALISRAGERGRAVPAFNVVTLEQADAVVAGAEAAGTSVLIQVSENAIRFHRGFAPLLAASRELADAASVDVGIHVDHLEDPDLAAAVIARAAELGVGSIMFDAASLPFEDNVALTARVTRAAQDRGLWVEGELGAIGGKGGAHTPGVRTDPAEARLFVAATGVDLLAVAVGSEHAMAERTARIDLDLVSSLADAVDVPLVLHGSSGVRDELLLAAVAHGIRKVNIGTALAVSGTAAIRETLSEQPGLHDPRVYLAAARESTRRTVTHLTTLVG